MYRIIVTKDTGQKPAIGTWGVADLALGDIFADPVPVRRPGVWVVGVDGALGRSGTANSGIGRMKIGLKL